MESKCRRWDKGICKSTLSLTSAVDGGWSTPRSDRFTPGKEPVPIVQEAGWAPGPFWTGAENLVPTGIRSPDRPARSVLVGVGIGIFNIIYVNLKLRSFLSNGFFL
jgi:hypothetical protein